MSCRLTGHCDWHTAERIQEVRDFYSRIRAARSQDPSRPFELHGSGALDDSTDEEAPIDDTEDSSRDDVDSDSVDYDDDYDDGAGYGDVSFPF